MAAAEREPIKARTRSEQAEAINLRAHEKWEEGEFRSAFRLMQSAAEFGAYGAKNNLGVFYDLGIGVKMNRNSAMHWYRKAAHQHDAGAAANIATIYRDEGKSFLALHWFQKAVTFGDIEANLEIAKLHLHQTRDLRLAIRSLGIVAKAKPGIDVTLAGHSEATELLKKLRPIAKRRVPHS